MGGRVRLAFAPDDLGNLDKIILPGVGYFDEGIRALKSSLLIQPLLVHAKELKTPLLGICLGMQLLCRASEEGTETGLGLINADVKKLNFSGNNNIKEPHMGWNIVNPSRFNPLIPLNLEEQT